MSSTPNHKTPAAKRKDFVRTNIPLSENMTSTLILMLLVCAGVAIAIKGRHFNPDIFNVRTGSLDSTAAVVEGKSQTPGSVAGAEPMAEKSLPATNATAKGQAAPASPSEESSAEGGGAGVPVAAKGEAMEILLGGIKPMSPTEFYTADNLFEKIDGRAPAYQGFHVDKLRCRSFTVDASAGSFVDVYEYGFDSPVDAFGMFSMERDPKGTALDFAPDGYCSGGTSWFFRQGAVYVQVIASDQKPETVAAAAAIAKNRAGALPADDKGLAGRRSLPSAGLIADSVSYVPENAQGQSSFKDVFQAKYKYQNAELPFFIMVAKPEEAASAWKSFQNFCGRFGKVDVLPDVNGGKIFMAQLFGKWKVVYQRGNELGGVFDASSAEAARAFVEKYLSGEIK